MGAAKVVQKSFAAFQIQKLRAILPSDFTKFLIKYIFYVDAKIKTMSEPPTPRIHRGNPRQQQYILSVLEPIYEPHQIRRNRIRASVNRYHVQ